MTLCIASRYRNGSIHLVTDSRLNFGSSIDAADTGTKVADIPLRLYSPAAAGSAPLIHHEGVVGVAVVGSQTTTYVVRELLRPILGSLQFAGHLADTSLKGIAEVAAAVLRAVSRETCRILFEKGLGQVILVGWCPEERRGRGFCLSPQVRAASVDVSITELFDSAKHEFFGSGAEEARALSNSHPAWLGYNIVRAVCEDANVPSVGGAVQFGLLEDTDFRVMGVRDYLLNHDLREIYTAFYLGGVEVYGGENLLGDLGMSVRERFFSPFESEILNWMELGYAGVNSTAHWHRQ